MAKTIEERLASKTMPSPTSCLLWTGALFSNGYAQIRMGGRNGRCVRVHRLVWQLANGPIPGDLDVLHTCDTPPCIRLGHLFLGTPKDNAEDRERKGRRKPARGENNGAARLSESGVLAIRDLLASGVSQSECARRFTMSPFAIYQIAHGHTWKHLA